MSKRPPRRKHVPQRTCVVCRTVRPRRDLVRIVRTPEGIVMLDEKGKCNGRGAYLCRQRSCLEAALKQPQLERALKTPLTAEAKSELREYAEELPQSLSTESEGSEH
ncbi:MAG: RNase P modulator RnpM [Anaerolineae bacterium]